MRVLLAEDDPDLARQLLPQGDALPRDDWRVVLVKDLTARAKARLKADP